MEALPIWFSHFYQIKLSIYPLSGATIVGVFVLAALLVHQALLSAAEMVFFSLNEGLIQKLKQSSSRESRIYFDLLGKPQKLFFTFSIANIITNAAVIVCAVYVLKSLFLFSPFFFDLAFQAVLVSVFVLFFGKIMPRLLASHRLENNIQISTYLMLVLQYVCLPLTWLLMKIPFLVKNMIQVPSNISLNELSQAIEVTKASVADEKKLLKSILRFGNTESREIMRSRVDIVAVDQNESFSSLLNTIAEKGFSRMPVYDGSLDKIIGILYSKDLIALLNQPSDYSWQYLLRAPYFVPETKKIDDLLEDFQLKKIHLAVVIDEFGGTSGIVTLEDILEEVVGEMHDAHQKSNNTGYIKIDDYNYIFEGKTLLNDFYRIVDCPDSLFKDEKGDADTLAGLILEITGEIPVRNSIFTCNGFEFRIIQSDNRRIEKIKITAPNSR